MCSGPVCSAVFPANYAFAFNPQLIGALNGAAWWAVMMFVFAAGLELDLGDAWENRRETAITAGCALIVRLLLGAAAAAVLLRYASLDDVLIWGLLALIPVDWERIVRRGAFLAGAVFDAKWYDRARLDAFRKFLLLAVMPVFLLSTGLRTN